jgi:predicted transcriptional regulator
MLLNSKATARDIMATDVYAARKTDRILYVTKQLCTRGFSGAPVIDEKRRLIGMLSEKDCIDSFLSTVYHNRPLPFVGDIMTHNVITVEEDADLLSLAYLFVNKSLRRVPVVREGILVGQISRRDLLKRVIQNIEKEESRESSTLYLSNLDPEAPTF